MPQHAFITGLAALRLTPQERGFLRSAAPSGVILFKRNCDTPDQVRALVAEVRDAIGDRCLVLIDQEGGRVQRLGPPHWRMLPPAAVYAAIYASEPERAEQLAYRIARLTAADLVALGIDTNCAPVADLPVPGAHDIIGNRAYGRDVATVTALARAVALGYMAGGVVPVVKHIPGHGRAGADSHLALPVVDSTVAMLTETCFAPFKALQDLPAAMTAHVVYSALDSADPASTSARVTREIIRGAIGFRGLLMSDDLSMKALNGPMQSRAAAVIAAGSDIALHCNGDLSEMEAVAACVPLLSGRPLARFERCLDVTRTAEPYDAAAAEADLAAVVGTATV